MKTVVDFGRYLTQIKRWLDGLVPLELLERLEKLLRNSSRSAEWNAIVHRLEQAKKDVIALESDWSGLKDTYHWARPRQPPQRARSKVGVLLSVFGANYRILESGSWQLGAVEL